MKKLLLASALGLLLTSTAQAAFLAGTTITGTGCDANNICFVNVSTTVPGCTNGAQIRFDGSEPNGKSWFATALTAKASGANVNVGTKVEDGTPVCDGNFAVLNFITLL